TPIASQMAMEGIETATTIQPLNDVTATEISAIATKTPRLTFVPVLTHTVTPPTEKCNQIGRIESHQIGVEVLPKGLDVIVYLPPCFEPHPETEYPLLILLHSQIHTNEDWLAFGADEIADRLILSGEVQPFLMVFPREEYYLQAPEDSFFDRAILDVLLPWVEKEYAACTARGCRAIGGISRGGGWALRLGLTNWDIFGTIGGHSPVPFSPDVYRLIYWLREIPEDQIPKMYMDIGDTDVYRQYAEAFHNALLEQGVPHEWVLNSGAHENAYWQAQMEAYLSWYMMALSLATDR
ncbi:MAG: alpha/beta hydrolase-fold protein, partial [Anaerolineaceae bacterium]|nr:alpha/beta hydrolase-fold protein [Anaerolineaceae bacterium]